MAYTKRSFRDPALQNAYMWENTSFDSVLETIRNRSISPVLQRYLRPGQLVLEAGCGNGAWVDWLGENRCRAIGIDTNVRIISQGTGRKLWLVENDVLHKCFRNETFDACLSLGVIEHFPEGPGRPLAELRRVLKRGGLLFVSTPCSNLVRRLVNHPLRDLVNLWSRLCGRRLHFVEYRFERHELINHVRGAGFEIIEHVRQRLSARPVRAEHRLLHRLAVLARPRGEVAPQRYRTDCVPHAQGDLAVPGRLRHSGDRAKAGYRLGHVVPTAPAGSRYGKPENLKISHRPSYGLFGQVTIHILYAMRTVANSWLKRGP